MHWITVMHWIAACSWPPVKKPLATVVIQCWVIVNPANSDEVWRQAFCFRRCDEQLHSNSRVLIAEDTLNDQPFPLWFSRLPALQHTRNRPACWSESQQRGSYWGREQSVDVVLRSSDMMPCSTPFATHAMRSRHLWCLRLSKLYRLYPWWPRLSCLPYIFEQGALSSDMPTKYQMAGPRQIHLGYLIILEDEVYDVQKHLIHWPPRIFHEGTTPQGRPSGSHAHDDLQDSIHHQGFNAQSLSSFPQTHDRDTPFHVTRGSFPRHNATPPDTPARSNDKRRREQRGSKLVTISAADQEFTKDSENALSRHVDIGCREVRDVNPSGSDSEQSFQTASTGESRRGRASIDGDGVKGNVYSSHTRLSVSRG